MKARFWSRSSPRSGAEQAAVGNLLKRIMKKYGPPRKIVTDGLRAYSAAIREIGNADRQEVGGRLDKSFAENSHQPFRRQERAMQRFRSMKTLQKFSSVHAEVHNHFNQERHVRHPRSLQMSFTATLKVAWSTPEVQLLEPLILLLLIADVGTDRLLVAPNRVHEKSAGPKVLPDKIALALPIKPWPCGSRSCP